MKAEYRNKSEHIFQHGSIFSKQSNAKKTKPEATGLLRGDYIFYFRTR